MSELKCPYCRHKLETWAKYTDGTSKVWCHECNIFGDSKLFEDLNKNKQQIKKLRKLDQDEIEEADELTQMYRNAIGIIKGNTMSNMKCPFCQQELKIAGEHTTIMSCFNGDCKGSGLYGEKDLWQELIRTRKALDYAIDVIQKVAKMSDKLSREYGETFVEQLDNIQAYCWQEGYVLTHEQDLERAITALEQKEHSADTSKKIEQKDK